MKFASYVYDYNYEPKSGPKPERYFGGMFTGLLNTYVWKVAEEQGTKDWFLLRRFMLTSTSAVHCLRKIETMADVPPDLKRNADAIARLLKMRVTEVPNAGHEAAIKSFIEHLSSLDLINDIGWFNEVRVTHMKVMRGIWSEYLWMYEDPTLMPDTFKNANLGYIGTFEDLQFAVALSNGMRALIKQEGRLYQDSQRYCADQHCMLESSKGWCRCDIAIP
jgi:hypothetical protein